MGAPDSRPFVPADSAGRWTKGLMVAFLALALARMASDMCRIDLLSRAATEGISEAEAAASDSSQRLIGYLQLGVYAGTSVAFLTWFHRVHRNLVSLGNRRLKYRSGWTVGGFFVPFLNLVRPWKVMREVWHGSDPSGLERDMAPTDPPARNHLGTPDAVGWWWALFVISGFVGRAILIAARAPNQTLVDLQAFTWLNVAADGLDLVSCLVAIHLVSRITVWQARRRDAMVAGGGAGDGALTP